MSQAQDPTSPTRSADIPAARGAPAPPTLPGPLADLVTFPLVDALFGRRSRRFALGDEIPDGPLAYRSGSEPVPLTDLERVLVLSAMGGTTGWHHSITRNPRYAPHPANHAGGAAFSVLGASGNPDVPGLRFRYDEDERWAVPNPTGLPGVSEAFCPPHHPDMAAAVEAFAQREFGEGGPFHPGTPGPWTDSPGCRGSAQVHDPEFEACVALQAQYVLDTFGKFPGTVPTLLILDDVQAHHLDLEFYDRFFRPGAHLRTHAEHMERWHPAEEG